jgi:hypothetical protein
MTLRGLAVPCAEPTVGEASAKGQSARTRVQYNHHDLASLSSVKEQRIFVYTFYYLLQCVVLVKWGSFRGMTGTLDP